MSAIDFVIRTRAGTIQHGSVGGNDESFLVSAGASNDISLNIRQSDLRGYDRAADDLLITLADGRVIVLEGYFTSDENRLFLSAEGTLNEVTFVQGDGGALFAQYGPTETWGKWSPSDDLIFVNDPQVALDAGIPYNGEEEEVSMLAAAGLLGAGGLGAGAAVGAAALGGAAIIGGGGGGGGGSTAPTVDNPDGDHKINGESSAPSIDVTGTSVPGAEVVVTIGGKTVTTTTGDDGKWSVTFTGGDFPDDGDYDNVAVKVTDPDGTVTDLDGPSFEIDTVAPPISATNGAVSTGDLFNETAHSGGGVTLSGTGEVGATVTVTIDGHSQTTTIGGNGEWSFTFDATVLPAGEYTRDVVITAEDGFGNTTTLNEQIQIDTVNEVALSNAPLTGDDILNAAEVSAGLTLTGTGQSGSTVSVVIEGVTKTATVAGDGTWSVSYGSADLTTGTYQTTAQVTSTDPAGNVVTTSHTFDVDTEINLTVNTAGVEGDGTINNAERADGATLTGTADAGATVEITIGSTVLTTTAASNGAWSVDIPASSIPTGETTLNFTAKATDQVGNVETTTGSIDVDTLVTNFGFTSQAGGDGTVNAQEAAQGISLTGTTEPGGTVVLTLGGATVNAVVAPNGSWTANFTSAQVPADGTTTLTAVSTDQAGNSETITQQVTIDTTAGTLTISPNPVEGDDLVNAAEAADGVVLTGTSDPGQMVTVTMNGVSHTVQTAANGVWTAPFAAHEIASGTYDAQITATITDSAGNTLQRTDMVKVDTEVVNFGVSTNPVEGDNVINEIEAQNGFELTGTTEPGGQVSVTFEGHVVQAVVDAQGNWTAQFGAATVPVRELPTPSQITIDTTDAAGNTTQTTTSVTVDTRVQKLNMSSDPVTADNVVNVEEAANGFELTGQVEAGATVVVTLNGIAHTATVNQNGGWTVDIPSTSIPANMDGNLPVTVTATDPAGNVRTTSESVTIDTQVPDTLSWEGYGRDGSGVDLIRTEITSDRVYLGNLVDGAGGPSVVDVNIDNEVNVGNQTYMELTGSVPDGSHLVLATTDAAGNTSGAYLVTDDPATNTVRMSDDIATTLNQYNVDTIDLQFAEDAELTITEAQIKALSDTTDTVVVHGGADDQVTISGAQANGQQTEDGTTYNVFTLGDATVLVEEDITNVVI